MEQLQAVEQAVFLFELAVELQFVKLAVEQLRDVEQVVLLFELVDMLVEQELHFEYFEILFAFLLMLLMEFQKLQESRLLLLDVSYLEKEFLELEFVYPPLAFC